MHLGKGRPQLPGIVVVAHGAAVAGAVAAQVGRVGQHHVDAGLGYSLIFSVMAMISPRSARALRLFAFEYSHPICSDSANR